MSAPPLFRIADARRISVVREVAQVQQVFDEDPVGTCMVAARVGDHGLDPVAIGGELWTRSLPTESLCFAGVNLIPMRGTAADMMIFADKVMSAPRRGCSSPSSIRWKSPASPP